MADYPDNLLPASFRGIPFAVEADVQLQTGRNLARHVFVQREESTTADLGRKQREFPVDAFVLGDDYQTRHDLLLDALETEGPGLLSHPFYGLRTVAVEDVSVTVSSGGIARFTVVFVEHSDPVFPSVTASPLATVQAATAALRAAASADFSAFWSVVGAAFVAARAISSVQTAVADIRSAVLAPVAAVGGAVGAISRGLDTIDNTVAALIDLPGDLVDAIGDVLDQIADVFALSSVVPAAAIVDAAEAVTAEQQKIADNDVALDRLVQRLGLAALADAIVLVDFASHDEAASARDQVAEALETAMETAGGDVYDELSRARSAMATQVTEQSADLPIVQTITIDSPTSAIEIAWRLYQDPDRADEIVARNNIPHGGFIGAGSYQVLSE